MARAAYHQYLNIQVVRDSTHGQNKFLLHTSNLDLDIIYQLRSDVFVRLWGARSCYHCANEGWLDERGLIGFSSNTDQTGSYYKCLIPRFPR